MVEIVKEGDLSAVRNMQRDEELLHSMVSKQQSLIRFYRWKSPSATIGYFLKPDTFFVVEPNDDKIVELAKRPTGGGVIFHGNDLTFSVVLPSDHPVYQRTVLDSYKIFNMATARAIARFLPMLSRSFDLFHASDEIGREWRSFCMAHPTQYDVTIGNRKIVGTAQRRTKSGLLHQTSVFLAPPRWKLFETKLRSYHQVIPEMMSRSSFILSTSASDQEIEENRRLLEGYLADEVAQVLTN